MMRNILKATHSYLSTTTLCILWFLGICVGYFISARHVGTFATLMHGAQFCSASIISSVSALTLPFIISTVLTYLNTPAFVNEALVFLYSLLYSFTTCGVSLCFESAGWLVRWLFLFSCNLTSPALFFFILRRVTHGMEMMFIDLGICLAIVLLVVILNCHLIDPLLISTLTNV